MRLSLSILCLVLALTACGRTEPIQSKLESKPPERALRALPNKNRQLSGLQPSPEVLARLVLQYLVEGKQSDLRSLLVTEDEFCKYLWPEFPANDIPNVTCEWVWGMDEAKSLSSLAGLTQRRGGKKYELLAVELGEPIEYKTFRIHKKAMVLIKEENAQPEKVALFGPILEIDDGYKLYSYYTRD